MNFQDEADLAKKFKAIVPIAELNTLREEHAYYKRAHADGLELISKLSDERDMLRERVKPDAYIISQLLACVEEAEGLIDGGDVTRKAIKHVDAWNKRMIALKEGSR